MNLVVLPQLPKLTAFLKGQDDTVCKQMGDYTFQLILYSQVQFSNFTRGNNGQRRFLWTGVGRVTSTTTQQMSLPQSPLSLFLSPSRLLCWDLQPSQGRL